MLVMVPLRVPVSAPQSGFEKIALGYGRCSKMQRLARVNAQLCAIELVTARRGYPRRLHFTQNS